MIKKCVEQDKNSILDFLQREPIYNTYIISDIEKYGFNQDYQDIYKQVNKQDKVCGIFLRYYQNFILAGNAIELDYDEILLLLEKEITVIMAKDEIIKNLEIKLKDEKLKDEVTIDKKKMYCLEKKVHDEKNVECSYASIEDVDDIYDFIMTIPEFKNIYGEKAMISNRILHQEGNHIFIKKDHQIIAHVNSAASTDKTSMIGGLCVRKEFRGQGYARKVLIAICSLICRENKIPCIFIENTKCSDSLLLETGFEYYGQWWVIQRRR